MCGRGELHLSILIETMRRQGYEFQVSKPEVIYKEIDGVKCEPIERMVADVPQAYAGAVIEKIGRRRGVLEKMEGSDRVRLEFLVPSRGLFGYRSEFMTDTRGEGIMSAVFEKYEPYPRRHPAPQRGRADCVRNGRDHAVRPVLHPGARHAVCGQPGACVRWHDRAARTAARATSCATYAARST